MITTKIADQLITAKISKLLKLSTQNIMAVYHQQSHATIRIPIHDCTEFSKTAVY